MDILVPVSRAQDIDTFAQAGANAFYLGFHDIRWIAGFGKYAELNRMSSFSKRANFPSEEQALDAARHIRELGLSCILALNTASYTDEQLYWLEDSIEQFIDIGCELIISDLPLAERCASQGFPVVLSTMAGIYNSAAVSMLEALGIQRIVLPRDISLTDMEKIVKKHPSVLFEAFLMRNGCRFSDSNCMAFHARIKGSLCQAIDGAQIRYTFRGSTNDRMEMTSNSFLYRSVFHKQACGLCAIYRMVQMGIHRVKIVGRADQPEQILADITLVKHCISLAQDCSKEEEFFRRMTLPDHVTELCLYGLNCYYSEARFST